MVKNLAKFVKNLTSGGITDKEIMHDASRMGDAFVNYLKKLPNIEIMYIAAPPDEMDMLNRVKIEIMKKLPNVQIFLSTQVQSNSRDMQRE